MNSAGATTPFHLKTSDAVSAPVGDHRLDENGDGEENEGESKHSQQQSVHASEGIDA
jgi:hypothetical protein